MHHEDIKAAIRKKGVTSAQLARHLEVTEQTVSNVIRGVNKSNRIASAIAKLTGLSLEVMWPEKYGPADTRGETILKTISKAKPTKARAAPKAQRTKRRDLAAAAEVVLIEPTVPQILGVQRDAHPAPSRAEKHDGPSSRGEHPTKPNKSERAS